MANSTIEDCGLSLQDTYDGNDATGSGDLVDLLFSQLPSQQSENPQPSSESTVEDSGLRPKDQFDEYDDSTLRQLVTNLKLNFTICQLSENCDELQPPQTETAQLTSEESIREESCLQTVGRMRCGASVPDGYSRPNQPASPTKPLGVDEGMPTEMSDGHISSNWQYTWCVAPDPIMEAEQETSRAPFSGVVSPLSDLMWCTNILTPLAQCDDQTRTTLCVGQTMHKSVQSSNVDKEDDPCGSGLRLEQFDHACGSNVVYNPSHQYLVTTTTSSNVPTEHSTQHDNLLQMEDLIKDIKGARYTQGGRYISGYADCYEELQAVLTRLAQITGSNWRMDKLISARLSDEARVAFPEKLNGSMKPRLFWMTNKGIPCILYDGVPFATGGSEKISCKPASKQRSKDVSLCKCDARIYVRSIWRFPSFPLRIAGNEKMSDIRKAMRTHMELLSVNIATGVVTPVARYYFSLPTAWAHTSHKVPEFLRPGKHFIPLHATLVEEIQRLLQTGNTFITEVKEHIERFAKCNLTVELALNPEDESLQVSREKVNGHMYHMLKDGKITMPEPEPSGTLSPRVLQPSGTLSPRVLQPSGTLPVCSDIQDSSGGEEDLDPCGGDQEWEQLGDKKRIALDGVREEVCSLLNVLGNQVYACHDIKYLHKLRRTLTDENRDMSNMLRTEPSTAHRRKRSMNATVTSFAKRLA